MNAESMRCPTCRAEQPWSDTCRRCKCDLRLLRDVASEFVALRKQCLQSLQRNQLRQALEQARRCFALHADPETQRLLATCEFVNGNWAQALAHVEQMAAQARGPEPGSC